MQRWVAEGQESFLVGELESGEGRSSGHSLKPPSMEQELYVECPGSCKSSRARVSTRAVPALLGHASSRRGTVTAPSLGLIGELPHVSVSPTSVTAKLGDTWN